MRRTTIVMLFSGLLLWNCGSPDDGPPGSRSLAFEAAQGGACPAGTNKVTGQDVVCPMGVEPLSATSEKTTCGEKELPRGMVGFVWSCKYVCEYKADQLDTSALAPKPYCKADATENPANYLSGCKDNPNAQPATEKTSDRHDFDLDCDVNVPGDCAAKRTQAMNECEAHRLAFDCEADKDTICDGFLKSKHPTKMVTIMGYVDAAGVNQGVCCLGNGGAGGSGGDGGSSGDGGSGGDGGSSGDGGSGGDDSGGSGGDSGSGGSGGDGGSGDYGTGGGYGTGGYSGSGGGYGTGGYGTGGSGTGGDGAGGSGTGGSGAGGSEAGSSGAGGSDPMPEIDDNE